MTKKKGRGRLKGHRANKISIRESKPSKAPPSPTISSVSTSPESSPEVIFTRGARTDIGLTRKYQKLEKENNALKSRFEEVLSRMESERAAESLAKANSEQVKNDTPISESKLPAAPLPNANPAYVPPSTLPTIASTPSGGMISSAERQLIVHHMKMQRSSEDREMERLSRRADLDLLKAQRTNVVSILISLVSYSVLHVCIVYTTTLHIAISQCAIYTFRFMTPHRAYIGTYESMLNM